MSDPVKPSDEARQLKRDLDALPDHYEKGADGGWYKQLGYEAPFLIQAALDAARVEGAQAERERLMLGKPLIGGHDA